MKRTTKVLVTLVGISLLGVGLLVKGSNLAAPPTGSWLPAGTMASARSGSAAVLLLDGRVLVTGGTDASGTPLATAEFFNSDGSFSSAPSMSFARSGHTATVLQDGRVLVAGGADSTGNATQTAELFDPTANAWSAAGPLMSARSGHTATLLASGQVLLAGGSAGGAALASLELFDPTSNAFTLASATLASPRQNHAAALLQDGRVLIVGGWDGTTLPPVPPATTGTPNALATSDIYDPFAGTVTAGPALSVARMNHTATTELDGKVAVIGGSNGSSDLASIEVFDPVANTWSLAPSSLATARQGHLAFPLPHNANILVVGGTSGGTPQNGVELYCPWTGSVSATGAMASARSSAAGSALSNGTPTSQLDGILAVSGGSSGTGTLASAEVYGFAWVKTDAADYPPGTTVNITGGGWLPNETVTITLVESPLIDTHGPFTAVADANGNISNSSFITDLHDVSVQFTLTAAGSVSQAQTMFTDSKPNTVTVGAQTPNPVVAGSQASFTVTISFSGNGTSCTANLSVSGLPAGTTGSSFTPASVTSTGSGQTSTLKVPTTAGTTPAGNTTFTVTATPSGCQSGASAQSGNGTLVVVGQTTTTAVTSNTPDPSVTGQAVSVGVTVSDTSGSIAPTGTVTVSDGIGDSCTTGSLAPSGAAGTASCSLSPSHAGALTLTASYAGNSFFQASSGTAAQTVNKASTATTITNAASLGSTPTVVGQAYEVDWSVTANPPASGTPTGSVTVNEGDASCTAFVVTGKCSLTPSTVGSPKTINVTYLGTSDYSTSNSSTSHTVNQAATTTTITSASPNPVVVGQSVTFNYTVAANAPSNGTIPGGENVTVSDGAGDSCTATVTTGHCAITFPTPGSKTLTATYTGDTNFSTSTSTNFTETVDPKLAITSAPFTAVAGMCSPTSVSVQTENADGSPYNVTSNTTVTLSSNSTDAPTFYAGAGCGGSAVPSITVNSGSSTATFSYKDNAPGTWTITASIGSGTGQSTATQNETINPTLRFSTTAFAVGVGACSGTITLQTTSGTGNPANVTSDTTISLSSTSTGGQFYNSTNCSGSPVTTVTVTSGSHVVNFSYNDSKAGTPTLTASAFSGTASVTQQETIYAKLAITTTQYTDLQGQCSPQMTVQTENGDNSPFNVAADTTVTLSSSLSGSFFSDAACTVAAPSVTIANGTSSQNLYFKDATAEGPTITAASTHLASATQSETIAKLKFTSTAITDLVGACSPAVTVQSQTGGGAAANLTNGATLNLSSTSGGGSFFGNSTCTLPATTTASISAGGNTATFYYKDATQGTPTLTAAEFSASDTQAETVNLQLALTSGTFTRAIGQCSPQITFETRNSSGAATGVNGSRTVNLASTSGGGTFYSDAACTSATTTVTESNGNSSGSFYYKDSTANNPTLTLSGTGFAQATQGETIVLDNQPPIVTLTFPPIVHGQNGWYNGQDTVPVVGTVDANDTTTGNSNVTTISCGAFTVGSFSGLGTPHATAQVTVSAEGVNSVSCTATDSAGNTGAYTGSTAMPVAVKIDTQAPTAVAGAGARAADHNGWYNAPVMVNFSGTDSNSGIASCTSTNYTTPDSSTASMMGHCTDNAGNQGTDVAFNFKFDSSPPTAALSVTAGTAGTNGWYTSDVTVRATGNDTVSNPTTCTADAVVSTETTGTPANGSCTNDAGLTTNAAPLTVKLDKTPPTGVALAVTVGTLGTNGWYVSDVTVHTSGTETISNPIVCTADQMQTTDSTGQAFNGSCTNDAGLKADASPLTVKLDKTPPTVNATADRVADHNGWYNHALSVSFNGTDATSGIASCDTAVNYSGPDNAGASVTGHCKDNAGNQGTGSLSFKYDATAPTGVSGAPNRVADHNGWYNHVVDVVFTGNDATSGIDACTNTNYSGPDTSSASLQGSCTDLAGNTSASVGSSTFKFDSTPPSANLAVTAGTPGTHGWYVSDVTVSTSGTDTVSNPTTCTADQFQAAETAGQVFNGSCTNDAGLTANAAPVTVKLDKTGPSANLAVSAGMLGTNGWYTSNVTVTTTGTDSISNPTVCAADQMQTTDTSGQVFHGSCTNDAGLTTSASDLNVKRDATPPTVAITPDRGADHNGWYNHALTFTNPGTDATSGIASCTTPAAYSGPDSGSASVSATCTDNAGNVGNGSFSFKYDSTPPTIAFLDRTAANGAGWNNTDVTVRWTCADATSGPVTSPVSQTLSIEGSNQSAVGTCQDNAGNSASNTQTGINIDKTPPVLSGSATPGPNVNGWNNTDVSVGFVCTDALSGVATGPLTPQVVSVEGAGQSRSADCTDVAGNTSHATVSDINIDKTPPTVSALASRAPDSNGWYNHALSVAWHGTDSLSGIASCDADSPYSGPDTSSASLSGSCKDKADNTASASYSFKYDATPPVVAITPDRGADHNGWYNHALTFTNPGTDATSGIASCTTPSPYSGPDSGAALVSATCTDVAGNVGNGSFGFKYDATPPTSVAVSADRGPDHNGWYNRALTATWSGADATSGIESCTKTPYSGPDNGSASLSGTCTDVAGNTSSSVAFNFMFDSTPPSVTATADRPADHNNWYNHALNVSFSGTDATSGIDTCDAVTPYSGPDTMTASVSGHCVDKAGNQGTGTLNFQYDSTPPTGVSGAPNRAADHNNWYNHAVTVQFAGTDATSGIDTCSAPLYSGPDTGAASTNGSCTDKAGNTSAPVPSSSFMYDATPPTGVVGAASRPPDHNSWYNHALTINFSGADATSGIDFCSSDPFSGPDSATASVNGTCTDKAGNTSAPPTPFGFKYDATPPTINIVAPANNATYILNSLVASNYTCSDSTSGVATCTGPVANGANISTSTVNTNNFTVNATDQAGNPATLMYTYKVQYQAGGVCDGDLGHIILQPINPDGSSVWKQGRTVPAKFRVCDANGISVGTPGVVSQFFISGIYNGTVNQVDETVAATNNDTAFRWDPTAQQWIFNISTSSLSANKTYLFTILLNDGTLVSGTTFAPPGTASFQFGLR